MALASCPARQGQQRSLRRIRQNLSLGIGTFAGSTQPGMGPVGLLLRGGLIPPPVRCADIVLAEVALIAEDDQAAGGEFAGDAPDPGGGHVMHGRRQGS